MSSSASLSSSVASVCASAPGKVILFGEHAVVYGEPAMAACLSDLRIWVKVTRLTHHSQLQVRLPDLPNVPALVMIPVAAILKLNLQRPPTAEDTELIHELLLKQVETTRTKTSSSSSSCSSCTNLSELAVSALTPVVYLVHQLASSFLRDGPGPSNKCGLSIVVRSKDLPVGAGLGSSAAFSVACAAALIRLTLWNPPPSSTTSSHVEDPRQQEQLHGQPNQSQLDRINQYAFYSEMLLHGTPSGIDNTVSTFGDAIVYTKDIETGKVTMETLSHFPPLNLVLTNTHVPRSTKQLVGHVRDMYHQHTSVVQPMLQAMGAITKQFRDWIVNQTIPEHGAQVMTLVQTNQHLLRAVGVSHPSLDSIEPMVEEALRDMNHLSLDPTPDALLTATKLTGAGGGGCAMTLVRPDLSTAQAQEVMQRISSKLNKATSCQSWFQMMRRQPAPWKYQCLTSRVGGAGVLWLDPSEFPEDGHYHNDDSDDDDASSSTQNIAWSNNWKVAAASVVAIVALVTTKLVVKR